MDTSVYQRGADAVVLDLFQDEVGGVVAAAPLIWDASVESSGIEYEGGFRQL